MVLKDILSVFKEINVYVSTFFAAVGVYLLEETVIRSFRGVVHSSGILGRMFHSLKAGLGLVLIIISIMYLVDMFR